MSKKVSSKIKFSVSLLLIAVLMGFTVLKTEYISPSMAVAAEKPTISKKSVNILIGEKYDLNIKNKVKNSTYKWKSSDKKIATVDSKGVVTAKSKGTAKITCTITLPGGEIIKKTCKVTVIKPAIKFYIKNKISKMNVGQEYDLNRRLSPSTSNDKTTWTSSDESIAKPDSLGVFTALKEGTVTITGKTLSGASDSVTITVVDKNGTVKNQEELDDLLGSGVALITIKTDEELKFSIKKGDYSNTKLVVDAPNAEVENYGIFKSIEIKQIKNNTWYEMAKGNQITISSQNTRIVVGTEASVKIETRAEGAVLIVENNGTVEELIIENGAQIEISGESTELIPVTVNAANVKIKTSVPVDLVCNEKLSLELLEGAEASKITAKSEDVIPDIKSDFSVIVIVDDKEKEITPTPTQSSEGSAGGGGGGGYIPSPTPVEEDAETYSLNKPLKNCNSITVKYGSISIDIDDSTLIKRIVGYLDDEDDSIEKWKNTTNKKETYNGMEVEVRGTKGVMTKTVKVNGNLIGTRQFEVTLDTSNKAVVVKSQNKTYTIYKINDQTIKISPKPSLKLEISAN